jgi:zinc protease
MARLLTRGNQARSGDVLAREIDGMAAQIEGFSGRSTAGLSFECLATHGTSVLQRVFECALQPTFSDEDVKEERRVVRQELQAEADDPAEVAHQAMCRLLYGHHPYALSRLGTQASLGGLTPARIRSHFRHCYPAARLVLALCGDFELEGVVELVRSLVPRPAGVVDRRPAWPGSPPGQPRRRRALLRREREQTHVVWGYPGFRVGDPRSPAVDLLMTILGGQSGRLFRALREEEGLVYHVAAGSTEGVDGGHLAIHAATAPDKLERAQNAMHREIEAVRRDLVSSPEIDRAKAYLGGQHAAGLQRRSRVAAHLAFGLVHGLGPEYFLAERIAQVERVTASQLRTVAQALLAPEQRVAAIVAARIS